MRWYLLAFLVWIAEIIMFLTILLIPVCMWLRGNCFFFEKPFTAAELRDAGFPL